MRPAVDDHAAVASATESSGAAALPLVPIILVVLVLDAFITLALEVLYLPAYLGTTAFPVTGVLAGLVNVVLVLGARSVSTRTAAMFLPLGAWTFGFLVCASTGPGGDIMLTSDWRTVLLLCCGLVPPLVFVYFRVNSGLFAKR